MKRLGSIAAVLLAVVCGPAQAERYTQIPDSEIAKLPHYCWVRIKELNSPEYHQLEAVMGPDLIHTHHYCVALVYIKRYYAARDKMARASSLRDARNNLVYLIQQASPSYMLVPDAYLSLGEVERLDGKVGKALLNYEKAAKLNPELPRAWGALADISSDLGRQGKALEYATEGLRHNPDATGLKNRYRKYGGKMPYPEPLVKEKPAPAPEPAAEPVVQAEEKKTVDKPKLGEPGNPYCRFCP